MLFRSVAFEIVNHWYLNHGVAVCSGDVPFVGGGTEDLPGGGPVDGVGRHQYGGDDTAICIDAAQMDDLAGADLLSGDGSRLLSGDKNYDASDAQAIRQKDSAGTTGASGRPPASGACGSWHDGVYRGYPVLSVRGRESRFPCYGKEDQSIGDKTLRFLNPAEGFSRIFLFSIFLFIILYRILFCKFFRIKANK